MVRVTIKSKMIIEKKTTQKRLSALLASDDVIEIGLRCLIISVDGLNLGKGEILEILH